MILFSKTQTTSNAHKILYVYILYRVTLRLCTFSERVPWCSLRFATYFFFFFLSIGPVIVLAILVPLYLQRWGWRCVPLELSCLAIFWVLEARQLKSSRWLGSMAKTWNREPKLGNEMNIKYPLAHLQSVLSFSVGSSEVLNSVSLSSAQASLCLQCQVSEQHILPSTTQQLQPSGN